MPQPSPCSRNARTSRLSSGHYAPHPAIMLCDRPNTSPSRSSGALLVPSTRTSTSQMPLPAAAGGKRYAREMRELHENAHALLQAEADAAAAAIEAAAEREAEAARRKEAMRHHESIQQQASATESTGSASRAGGRAAHTEKSSGALAVEKSSERQRKETWSEGLPEEKWSEGLPEETRRGGHSVAGIRKPLEYACSPREARSSPASPRENQRTSQCSSVEQSTSGHTWRREKHSVYMLAAESRCRDSELVAIERVS
ncbi:hypothetical protein AB1Y20_004887 [Prymnesium parvum]|uniref:Uncharacterized protein n=1 Tax=Prymnesium parvum TaxID=97485 RepID=A0AB34IXW8_PRYPA